MKKKTEIQHYRGLYVQEHRRPYGSAHITFSKVLKGSGLLVHHALIITYADAKRTN